MSWRLVTKQGNVAIVVYLVVGVVRGLIVLVEEFVHGNDLYVVVERVSGMPW